MANLVFAMRHLMPPVIVSSSVIAMMLKIKLMTLALISVVG